MSYAQVVATIADVSWEDRSERSTYAMTAAGGFPGELLGHWRGDAGSFDCEYGFSCMGYELAGAWGAKMAMPDRDVVTFVGDGSYLMLNSELFSASFSGHPFVAILCDNDGFAVIERLQTNQGGEPFNNRFPTSRGAHADRRVDFVAHARSLGADAEEVTSIDALADAYRRVRDLDRPAVLYLRTSPSHWTEGGAWWEVGVPEVNERPEVRLAREALTAGKSNQRTW